MLGTNANRINYLRDVQASGGTREYITRKDGVDQGAGARTQFMEDEAYGQALDCLVVACADVAIIRFVNGVPEMLIGVRQQEPHPDAWVIGGRMRHGESFAAAATRNVLRELGFTMDPARLNPAPLGPYSLIWDTRAQAPATNGCHMLSCLLVYRYGDEPIRPNEEYSQLYWAPLASIANSAIDACHPALRQMAFDVSKQFI